MFARVSTTVTHYSTAVLKWMIIYWWPGGEDLELTSDSSRKAKRNIRKLYQFSWYRDFKKQYRQNWDHQPAVHDFMKYVEFETLKTEEGKEKFMKNFKYLLDSLEWK